jgi:hypothetical protein
MTNDNCITDMYITLESTNDYIDLEDELKEIFPRIMSYDQSIEDKDICAIIGKECTKEEVSKLKHLLQSNPEIKDFSIGCTIYEEKKSISDSNTQN